MPDYALRGLSLIYLPFSNFSLLGLSGFAVLYGLDWIATIPPTLRLTMQNFGEARGPMIFGWIAAGHQIGAALAAWLAGYLRTLQGDYVDTFLLAGVTGLIAALLALLITPDAVAPAHAAAT